MSYDDKNFNWIFFGHLLLLGIVLLLQTWNILGIFVKPDFILVFLVVSALFLDFPKIFLMILVSLFFLKWRPDFSPDILVFAFLPIITLLIRRIIPGRIEIVGFLAIIIGTAVFYSLTSFKAFWMNPSLLGVIFLLNAIFGALIFFTIFKFFNPSK